MIPGDTIDGVYVPSWKMSYWVYMDRIRYASEKRAVFLRLFIARHIPREIRLAVIVLATSRAMGNDKSPDEVTYPDIFDAA